MSRWPLLLLLLVAASGFAHAQVSIREVCASNVDLILDEDGTSSDWIELLNESSSPVDLSGWCLSDDPDDPYAWTIPNLILQPGERLFIWASGKGTNHPNTPHFQPLVTQGSQGSYFPGTTEPPLTWRDLDFDDSSWSTGPSGYGFGDDDDATVVMAGTIYVRHDFKVEAKIVRSIDSLYFHADFDDGYIAYLNGNEIWRENMAGAPGTDVPTGTLASAGHEAVLYQGGTLPAIQLTPIASHLRVGDNVLSVQVHNGAVASSDLSITTFLTGATESPTGVLPHPGLLFKDAPEPYELHTNFKLSASGEVLALTNKNSVEVDQLTVPRTYANTSFGRSDVPGRGPEPLHFLTPTPGELNTTEGRPGYAAGVSASPEGALTMTGVSVLLDSDEVSADIRYSLDCTEPTEQSALFGAAIQISGDGATVLRARAFQQGLWPGPICTNTYIVNAAPLGDLPVFSLVTEPDNLWDWETGIYVLGPNADSSPPYHGANFWQDWERPLHAEFFEDDGVRELAMDLGTKIHGGYSRSLPQKSMRLVARGGYGESTLDHAFFDELEFDEYKQVILRNSGNDFYFALSRDPIVHLASKGSGLDDMAYRPAMVYLNGEYWGLMGLRERQSEEYLADHHGVDPDTVNMLEGNAYVIQGSNEHYQEMLDYLRSNDMSDDAHFEVIASMMDTHNYSHYFANQIWSNNTDWPQNNIKFWRAQEPGAKWRWLLYDTDFGLGLFGGPFTANSLGRIFNPNLGSYWARELFLELMLNDGFRDDFIRIYADLLNTSLSPAVLLPVVDEVEAALIQDIPEHHQLWNGSFLFWQSHMATIREFITNRTPFCRDHVRFQFQLAGMYDLSLDVSPPGAGRIQLTAAEIDGPFTGTYFLGVPVDISAVPNNGYSFTAWSDPTLPQTAELRIDPLVDYSLTAQFTPTGGGGCVLNELQYHPARSPDPGDWVELHNPNTAPWTLDGWELRDEGNAYSIPDGTVVPALGYLVICRDLSAFSAEFPTVTNVVGGFGFGLSAAGERIELHAQGALHDFVEYDDSPPWPTGPDGGGTTLELIDAGTDNSLAGSWAESTVLGGTPGAQNSVTP